MGQTKQLWEIFKKTWDEKAIVSYKSEEKEIITQHD
jgi:hypothetical protein